MRIRMSCRAKSWRKQIFRLNICHFKVSLDECWRSYEWAGIVVGKWKSRNFDDDYVCCSGLKGSLSDISLSYKIVLKIPLAREILYCTMTLIKSSTNVYDLYFSWSTAAMWGICQGLVERDSLSWGWKDALPCQDECNQAGSCRVESSQSYW